MQEIWKTINHPDLPDYYQISDFGRIRALPYVDRRGWRRKLHYHSFKNAEISLRCADGRVKWFPVAALVLLTFIGPPKPQQRLSRHLDDDRNNNHVANLAWGTDGDNIADAIRNGRNFASCGHQGCKHSDETKQKLRNIRLGKPTGHKMTPEHRAAIMIGYRKRFPDKKSA